MELARLPSLGTAETDDLPPRVRKLLPDYFPSDDTALKAKVKWIRNCAGWRNETVEEPMIGLQALGEELSKDELARARYVRSYKASAKYVGLGLRWGPGISLAVDGLKTFEKWCDMIKIENFKTASGIVKALKSLTDLAKKYGPLWDKDWPELVNGETLGGFRDAVPNTEFVPEIRGWVEGDIHHSIQRKDGTMDEELFLKEFKAGMMAFLSDMPGLAHANEDTPVLSEWVKEPGNWARSGSTHVDKQIRYKSKTGQMKNVGKTKWRTALATSPSDILAEMLTAPAVQKPKVIQKREKGKVRGVVSSDDLTYLRMSYFGGWLDKALKGNIQSTLYMSNQAELEMWETMPRSNAGGTVKMPLDQAHFDWQQSFTMSHLFYDVVDELIETLAKPEIVEDLLRMSRLVRKAVTTPSVMNIDGEIVTITKGILSGWRLTSLKDSAMNAGEIQASKRQIKEYEIEGKLEYLNVQGDDDDTRHTTCGHAVGMARAYEIMNFQINPAKFWIETHRNEYLRKYSDDEKVSGYPLRGLGSLMWRNPITIDQPKGLLRMTEQVRSWNLVMSRGYSQKEGTKHMFRDIGWGNSISRKEVISVLSTPASLGGVGYYPPNLPWTSFSPGTVERETVVEVGDIRGLDHEIRKLKSLGVEMPKEEVVRKIAGNLVMRDAKTEVIPGEVKPIEHVMPFIRPISYGYTPLKARPSKDIPSTLSTIILQSA